VAERLLDCRFFKSAEGTEPVRDWLKTLPSDDMKEIGADIERIQWRWPVSMPLVRTLGGGLFEVRTKIDTLQYRVLFCIADSSMVLLHGFVKKSRAAPDEIAIGRKRLKELKEG
jgi:phage-related protein